jgi:hypothetical protein
MHTFARAQQQACCNGVTVQAHKLKFEALEALGRLFEAFAVAEEAGLGLQQFPVKVRNTVRETGLNSADSVLALRAYHSAAMRARTDPIDLLLPEPVVEFVAAIRNFADFADIGIEETFDRCQQGPDISVSHDSLAAAQKNIRSVAAESPSKERMMNAIQTRDEARQSLASALRSRLCALRSILESMPASEDMEGFNNATCKLESCLEAAQATLANHAASRTTGARANHLPTATLLTPRTRFCTCWGGVYTVPL